MTLGRPIRGALTTCRSNPVKKWTVANFTVSTARRQLPELLESFGATARPAECGTPAAAGSTRRPLSDKGNSFVRTRRKATGQVRIARDLTAGLPKREHALVRRAGPQSKEAPDGYEAQR